MNDRLPFKRRIAPPRRTPAPIAAAVAKALGPAAALAFVVSQASAQAVPDAGQLLRESQQQQPLPPITPPLPAKPPAAAVDDTTGATVLVRGFKIEGASRYDDATLQAAVAPFKGRTLNFAGLQEAADAVAEYYRRQGWHTAALLPEQDLKDGVVRIVVVESRLGRVVTVPDTVPRNVPKDRIQGYIDHAVKPGEALNLDDLARATAISNELPGVRVGTVLAGGTQPGETDVQVRLEPRPAYSGYVGADNQDAISTGAGKAIAALALNSPLGYGEQMLVQASASEGKRFGRLAATAPVGPLGWRAGASYSVLSYKLVGDASRSAGTGLPNGAKGDASIFGVNASVPLWRGTASNVSLLLAQEYRATKNETALGVTSDKRVDSTTVTLQSDMVDNVFGGGSNNASLVLTHGRLDLGRVPLDLQTDQLGHDTQGSYTRLNLSFSRNQRVTEKDSAYLNLAGQISSRNLDAGEQFSLGGPQGVRAFPLLEGSGDEGLLANLGWRHQFNQALQVEAFYDAGRVRRAKRAYTGSGDPASFNLQGAGVAVDWAPIEALHVNATVAQRLKANPAALPNGRDSDGTRREPRVWLGVTYSF